ncbi:hypothetical protein BRD05_03805 [Halobacteriales archaeon QS_9_70_65]|nr:MAG: hypothetical protein BRD05_03805 [Halobacteriales archaeon QS_9_70_65]
MPRALLSEDSMTRRGQSSPLAVVLLIGIVLTGATTVAVLGGGSIDDVSSSAESERASQEMTQVASEAAAVALGGSKQRGMTVDASQGQLTVEDDASWICVENGTTTNRSFILPENVSDASCGEEKTYMGTIRYDTGDTTVAYEGGGVWRRGDDGNARMVSPPEFHYRGDTLTLPVVVVSGDVGSGGSTVDLTATAGPTDRADSLTNPLPDSSGSVYVTIHSEYYRAWGEFIAGRTAGTVVELDDDAKTVTVELVVPSPATIGDGDVVTDGGVNPIEGTVDGDVYTIRQGEKVSVTSGGRVDGSIHSQRKVEIQDPGSVGENIFAERKVTVNGDEVGGTIHSEEKVTLSNSGVSVGGVRTGSELTFNSNGVTVDGDIHAETLKSLEKNPTLNGDVYTDGTYGKQDDGAGVDVDGELHASDGIYTDDTTVGGPAYTDADLEDTDSDYDDEVHVGGDADLSGTTVSRTVYVAGDVNVDSASISQDLNVGGDLTCSGSNTVSGDVYVTGSVGGDCSLNSSGSASLGPLTSPDDPKPPESPDEPSPDPPKIEVPPEDEVDPVPASCTNGGTIQVGSSGEHCELPPGTYKVSKLDIDQGKLTFEEGGRIELYVSDDLSLSSGNITTAPDGEHDATRVEINYYGTGGANIKTNVTGVINAPNAKVDIDEGDDVPHIHGAIIAEKVQGDNGAQIHYDEDLSGRTVGDGRNGTTSVQYLHVTTNELEIED